MSFVHSLRLRAYARFMSFSGQFNDRIPGTWKIKRSDMPDALHEFCPRMLTDCTDRLVAQFAVTDGDTDLDKLVIRQRRSDLLKDAVGQAVSPDHDDGFARMGQRAQEFTLSFQKSHFGKTWAGGFLFIVYRDDLVFAVAGRRLDRDHIALLLADEGAGDR